MDIYAVAERAMGMDDRVWLRHASPWSVWTRIVTPMPLFILVGFSRQWLGWGALAVVLLWVWASPRLFPAPRDLESWAAQGVLGGVIVSGAKTWFVDRMVWVWQDFQSAGHGATDLTLAPAT